MTQEFRIVVVCTANICRSPMAEAMIRHALRAGGPDAAGVVVESAGVYGHEGSPIAPGSASALRALGIEDDDHRGRRLTTAIVGAADLVLTMEEGHRDAILAGTPEARDRTFTLREFARLVGGQAPPSGAGAAARARALVTTADSRRTRLPWPGVDDVPDPYGGPSEGYHACAALILGEVGTLLRPLLVPLA
ncbi:low molecular weight phosphatase family protein [Actinoallomurus oryzae]|uniref:protein-tyrosine-phosphatase n=1 Tax=Actinoallomurus oryzae TaxID=502180 RepID=A0ABP8R8A5_9ACTN